MVKAILESRNANDVCTYVCMAYLFSNKKLKKTQSKKEQF